MRYGMLRAGMACVMAGAQRAQAAHATQATQDGVARALSPPRAPRASARCALRAESRRHTSAPPLLTPSSPATPARRRAARCEATRRTPPRNDSERMVAEMRYAGVVASTRCARRAMREEIYRRARYAHAARALALKHMRHGAPGMPLAGGRRHTGAGGKMAR